MSNSVICKKDIEFAYQSIKDEILKTPLIYSSKLSSISGTNVYLKMEHLQVTDSFKIRGVITKIKSLEIKDFNKIFVAASTGNHAAAFGYAAEKFNFKGIMFLSKNVTKEKLKGISNYSFEKVLYGNTA